MAKRYKEVFDPNHSQECICHRGPMNRGLEESPEGDFVDIEDYEELKNQLAKANERVEELESKHLNLVLWHNLDPQQAKLYSDKYANKFAIEQKIEALKELLTRKSHKSVHHLIEIVIDSYENQLRKEQAHEKT